MHRFAGVAIAVVLVGCATKAAPEKSAASPANPAGSSEVNGTGGGARNDEPHLPTGGAEAPPPPPGGGDHTTDSAGPRDQARAQGVLGATDQRFDDSPIDGSPTHQGGDTKHLAPPKTGTTAQPLAQARAIAVTAMLDTKQSNELATLVKGHLADIGACHAKSPDAKGRLDLTFTVGDKGGLETVTVAATSTLKDAAVSDCVSGVIKNLALAPATKAKRGLIKLTF